MATTTSSPEHPAAPESDEALRARQMRQAEELLGSSASATGFAKPLFRGEFRGDALFPYPELSEAERPGVEAAVAAVREFADTHIDAAAIDREADIPPSVIRGLADLGVLGMAAPVEWGGRGISQMGYCKIMEVIGGHCAATAVFVNAHHSIGLRALVLFGTPEQKARWLPPLVRGEKLAAFALTEEQAGSDASNVQTIAQPSEDGQTYILNGSKRYITNGGDRRHPDRHGPHARPPRRRVEGHRVPGDARHARLRGRRGADAQVRHPRDRDGPAGLPRHARAGDEHPRAARQGPQGRADRARLRPDDLRRQLHGTGQGLPGRGRAPRRPPRPVRPARWPTSSSSRRRSPTSPPRPTPWRRRPTRRPP